MINARYIFELDGECPIETIGGDTTGRTVAGDAYHESDYFGDEYQPTYVIDTPNGGFTVRQEDVVEIHDIRES